MTTLKPTDGLLSRDLTGDENAFVQLGPHLVLADNSIRTIPGTNLTTGGHRGPRGARCLLVAENGGWRLIGVALSPTELIKQ